MVKYSNTSNFSYLAARQTLGFASVCKNERKADKIKIKQIRLGTNINETKKISNITNSVCLCVLVILTVLASVYMGCFKKLQKEGLGLRERSA